MTMLSVHPLGCERRSNRVDLLRALALCLIVLVATGCDALISPQHRIDRAREDIAAGKWGLAAIELRKVVQADPHNAQGWLLLAQLSLDAADPRGAANALDHAAKSGAKGAEVDALRARALLTMGQPQALIDAVSDHSLGLAEPERSIALARAYNALRQPDRALALLQPALVAHPHLTEARVVEAESLADMGRSDAALHEIDLALASAPKSYSALLLKGQLLERGGDFSAAEQVLAASIGDMLPGTELQDRARALIALTEARLAQGKIGDASKSQAVLAKLLPDSAATEVLSARIKLAHRDYVGGIADLEQAVQRAPNLLQARMLLGEAQAARGNLEQARMQLEQVVRQAPDNVGALKLLANVRLKLGQPEGALQLLTPALAENASDPELLSLIGRAEQRVGNSKAVTQALERAVQGRPQDRNLRLDLAAVYLQADRAKDALSVLEQTPDSKGDLRRDQLLVTAIGKVRGARAASAEVDKLLAAHPRDRALLNFAGAYYASQRQFDHARVLIHQALGPDGRDVPTLINLARVDIAAGDDAGAEASLRTALAEAPKNLAVRVALAEVLARKREFAAAEKLLATVDGPHVSPTLPLALAQIELAQGNLKQADAALDRAIALAPGHPELLNGAGVLLLEHHQYDAALARFRKATQLASDNAEYWLNAARAQLALDHPDAAKESLEKADQIEPQWLPAVSLLALIDLREKNAQSALGRVSSLLAAHPGNADALVLKGDVEVRVGRVDDALADYSAAQHSRPSATVAVKLFEASLAAHHQHPEEPLEHWLASEPNDTVVRTVLGDYALISRDYKRAAREFQEVVDRSPGDVVALNNLAWSYLQMSDPRAESVAAKAYKLAPGEARVDDTYGWILARRHEIGQALPLLTRAAKKAATDPDLQYHYAYVLAQSGKRAEAREVLSKITSEKRDFDSKRAAKQLLMELGT